MRARSAARRSACLAALVSLGVAGPAGAAQLCVGATGTACDGGVQPFTTAGLDAAIAAASASANADEVRVAGGALAASAFALGGGDRVVGSATTPTVLKLPDGASTAIAATGTAALADLTLEGSGTTGVSVSGSPTTITLDRVTLRGFARALWVSRGTLVVRDTLVDLGPRAGATGLWVSATSPSAVATATVRRVTVAGTGTGQTGVSSTTTGASANATANLADSVLFMQGTSGTAIDCFRTAGTGGLSAVRTAYRGTPRWNGCAAAAPTSAVDITLLPPWFVNPSAGDYRLQSYSALVDAGTTVAPPETVDRLGQTRFVDGKGAGTKAVDLGAFEYGRRPPTAPVIDLPQTTFAPGQAIQFKASATDPDGEYPYVTWNFGDGTDDVNGPHAYAALGTYTATATATDPVGLTSSTQVQISIANPAGPPVETPAPTPTALDPFQSATGPRVRVISAPTRPVRRGTGGFSTTTAAGPTLATIETAGAVTLRVQLTRLAPGRKPTSRGRCRTTAKKGKRCTVRVKVDAIGQIPVTPGTVQLGFGGRLGGRTLAKGAYEATVTPVGIDKRLGTPITYPLTLR
ncbi:MAG: PKD domain-containing protein [Patulibacter minatonensis]